LLILLVRSLMPGILLRRALLDLTYIV